MKNHEEVEQLYLTIAHGDEEAYKFILAWQAYCHGIDDIVDGEVKDVEGKVAVFFTAAAIFTSNYWAKNKHALYPLVAIITGDYVDSNTSIPQADVLRGSGNNMLIAVAFLQGGYSLMRHITPKLRKLSWEYHHTLDSKPI